MWGIIYGTTKGIFQGDTRILVYGSHDLRDADLQVRRPGLAYQQTQSTHGSMVCINYISWARKIAIDQNFRIDLETLKKQTLRSTLK